MKLLFYELDLRAAPSVSAASVCFNILVVNILKCQGSAVFFPREEAVHSIAMILVFRPGSVF